MLLWCCHFPVHVTKTLRMFRRKLLTPSLDLDCFMALVGATGLHGPAART